MIYIYIYVPTPATYMLYMYVSVMQTVWNVYFIYTNAVVRYMKACSTI